MFDVGCSVFVVCWVLNDVCLLFVVERLMFAARCALLAVRRLSLVDCCVMDVACLLFVGCCLFVVC